MKKIWFLGLLLVANISYAQISIQKHFFHCTQKDSAKFYLWEDFMLQQAVEYPDTFYCDGRYFFPSDGCRGPKIITRRYSKVMDSVSIQGVPNKNNRMLAAVRDVVKSRISHVVYGRSRSMKNYGVVLAITTTDYICEYDHVAKTVHFSHSETTVYPWKRTMLLAVGTFVWLIGVAWVLSKDKKVDYFVYALFLLCTVVGYLLFQTILVYGMPISNIFWIGVCLSACSFTVLRIAHSFFMKRERLKQ